MLFPHTLLSRSHTLAIHHHRTLSAAVSRRSGDSGINVSYRTQTYWNRDVRSADPRSGVTSLITWLTQSCDVTTHTHSLYCTRSQERAWKSCNSLLVRDEQQKLDSPTWADVEIGRSWDLVQGWKITEHMCDVSSSGVAVRSHLKQQLAVM